MVTRNRRSQELLFLASESHKPLAKLDGEKQQKMRKKPELL